MSNLFPGMNPYLEQRHLWADVHASLIVAIRSQLTPALPTGFRARIEQYLRVEEVAERVRPDLTITTARRGGSGGGVATLERPATERTPPVILRSFRETVPQRYINIVTTDDRERVVTAIEVFSPANKTRGQDWEEYARRRDGVLASDTHLLEIDLLRAGEHTVAAPHDPVVDAATYRVCLRRAGEEGVYEVWPVALNDPLPAVRVPLTEAYPDLYVDLQTALERVLTEGDYAADFDYRNDPPGPLAPADAAWLDSVLRANGLR